MAREKTSNLRQVIEDRRQSKALICETAEHIHKQIKHFSSAINALQNGTKLGVSRHGVLLRPMENVAKL